ncbi:MAG TPA: OmpA family protein [Hyphomicrobiaceae bacterium]|nr:OmpA family protein [Hyphomicrobiaceae bacterium]
MNRFSASLSVAVPLAMLIAMPLAARAEGARAEIRLVQAAQPPDAQVPEEDKDKDKDKAKRKGRPKEEERAKAEDERRRQERAKDDAARAKSEAERKSKEDQARAEAEKRKQEQDKKAAERPSRDKADRARLTREQKPTEEKAKAEDEEARKERAKLEQQRAKLLKEREAAERERAKARQANQRQHEEELKRQEERLQAEERRLKEREDKLKQRGERTRQLTDEQRRRAEELRERAKDLKTTERRLDRLEDVQRQRQRRIEEGGRIVIDEPDRRRIVKDKDRLVIRHDETARLRFVTRDVRTERRRDGITVYIFTRGDGIQIVSEVDDDGRLIRRYRRTPQGRQIVLIDNSRFYRRDRPFFEISVNLPPPVIRIPRERYIVEYSRASEDELYETLLAPPVERLGRTYSLDEIRYSHELRARMRRIDLDEINFEFGSWEVTADQMPTLERLAGAINRVLRRSPDEVFLIEGYTDAVGSEEDNLSLSDRRAEAVAVILSEVFEVPPENLVTQGYGEQFLKVETEGPERANRRVAVRRITPMLSQGR